MLAHRLFCVSLCSLLLAAATLPVSAEQVGEYRFFRAINLNGPPVTIDGHAWQGKDASDYTAKANAFENQAVPLKPEADAERARMIRSSRWGEVDIRLQKVPEGIYSVFIYVWEDNDPETFSISLNECEMVARHESGAAGHWQRLGPWPARVSQGEIRLTTRGGAANVSGIEVWQGRDPALVAAEKLAAAEAAERERAIEEARQFWSFQPVKQPSVPSASDAAWPLNEIDHFILARLHERNLQPVEVADRRTLIRRATFDLIGLPPTSSEVEAFVADPAPLPDAFAKIVERLLNSPHYGERWGRHWMDVVRYADTAGDNSDFPIPELYLYRNYIIDSFNEDKPYDQFLREQIAGDLLPADTEQQRHEQIIATGYIALSRRFGSVIVDYPQHLTIEDTLDNLGRSVLGLTISCARCHDHKFDAISQHDYYGLYGIFASTQYAFPGIELLQEQKHFVPLVSEAELEKLLAPHRQQEAELKERVDKLKNERSKLERKKKQLGERQAKAKESEKGQLQSQVDDLSKEIESLAEQIAAAEKELEQHRKRQPDYPRAYGVQDGTVADAAVHVRGEPNQLGEKVPRKFLDVLGRQRLDQDQARSSGRLQLAHWLTAPDNPLTARVMVNRIWQYHFGAGLIETASDFGTRGTPPSHPQLLDWLAHRFVQEGWSIKQMHRLMMNSKTYQLASSERPENLAVDPDNRTYWRFNRRRLDAESLRDAMLAISGNLDPTRMEEPHPFPATDKWEFTQHDPFRDEYESNRRSVYLMTKRLTALPFFTTFDGPDRNATTPVRDSSVTTTQALYLMNDPFVHEQAAALAQRLLNERSEDAQRLELAFELVYNRPPRDDERQTATDFLRQLRGRLGESSVAEKEQDQLVWQSLARSLFRTSEFLYVD